MIVISNWHVDDSRLIDRLILFTISFYCATLNSTYDRLRYVNGPYQVRCGRENAHEALTMIKTPGIEYWYSNLD